MFQRLVVRVPRTFSSIPTSFLCVSSSKSSSTIRNRFLSTRHPSVPSKSLSPLLYQASLTAISTSAICAFCSTSTSCIQKPSINAFPKVVLYQYEPCPYCCKVKAVLDYLNIPYKVVEVNPVTKKETKEFTTYSKVPVVCINNEVIVDSSVIISRLRDLVTSSQEKDRQVLEEEEQWRQWVDKKLIILTPPNIYRTIPEALQAFEYCLTEGKFTPLERRVSKYFGAMVMYLIAKRAKKKYEIQDERQALYSALEDWVEAIGDKRPFLGGDEPNMADLSVFGVLRAMHGLDTYKDIMRDTNVEPWFTRMTVKVGASSRIDSN